ncbi:M20/M25/M40 family metallo-hydrolase [Acidobacteriota bacterium]
MTEKLQDLRARLQDEIVDITRKLVRTPSLSGREGDMARLCMEEMERLGYDTVETDRVGNVLGTIRGRDNNESRFPILFTGHMDHVETGDSKAFPHPPFDAVIDNGLIWGRGASDMKGAIAAMIVAGAEIKKQAPLSHDLIVGLTVQEEVGGLGAKYLCAQKRFAVAVVGEASSNDLTHGHRGRVGVKARFSGRSGHASAPDRSVNPNASAARFIEKAASLAEAVHPELGASTSVPTAVVTDPCSHNIIPGLTTVDIDYRFVPGEVPEDILERARVLGQSCLESGVKCEVTIPTRKLVTYTGVRDELPDIMPSLHIPKDHPYVLAAAEALEEMLGRSIPVRAWDFATDGGHTSNAGIPTFGFGPSEEGRTHTVEDAVSIDMLTEGLAGYIAVARALDHALE